MNKVENIDETPAFAKHVLPAVPSSEVYLEDCVKALKRFNDNHFDLAIVDPPYGIDWMEQVKNPNKGKNWKQYENKDWDKMQEFSGAVFEMAWTSFTSPAKAFRMSRVEAYTNQTKIHPTQKPTRLYDWILHNYAKPNDLILDTHLGSGSSRIAAYKGGFNFVGFEIDQEYYEKQEKRFNDFKSQLRLF